MVVVAIGNIQRNPSEFDQNDPKYMLFGVCHVKTATWGILVFKVIMDFYALYTNITGLYGSMDGSLLDIVDIIVRIFMVIALLKKSYKLMIIYIIREIIYIGIYLGGCVILLFLSNSEDDLIVNLQDLSAITFTIIGRNDLIDSEAIQRTKRYAIFIDFLIAIKSSLLLFVVVKCYKFFKDFKHSKVTPLENDNNNAKKDAPPKFNE